MLLGELPTNTNIKRITLSHMDPLAEIGLGLRLRTLERDRPIPKTCNAQCAVYIIMGSRPLSSNEHHGQARDIAAKNVALAHSTTTASFREGLLCPDPEIIAGTLYY